MAQFFTDFSEYTAGTTPGDWEVNGSGTFNAGDVSVQVIAGTTSGNGLKIGRTTSAGNRYTVLSWDDTAATDFEVFTRFRAPNGFQQYYGGAGVAARIDRTAFYRTAYAARTSREGYTGSNALVRGLMANSPGTELDFANIFASPPQTNTWMCQLIRCNADNIRAWWWFQGNTPKTSADTPDCEVTDATYVSGYAGIVLDFQDSWYAGNELEVDVFGVGTGGDEAPQTATSGVPSVTLVAPLASEGNRLRTTPDLADGDIVEWETYAGSGSVTVNTDGSFVADAGVTHFRYRVNDGGGFSDWVIDEVRPAVVRPATIIWMAPQYGSGSGLVV